LQKKKKKKSIEKKVVVQKKKNPTKEYKSILVKQMLKRVYLVPIVGIVGIILGGRQIAQVCESLGDDPKFRASSTSAARRSLCINNIQVEIFKSKESAGRHCASLIADHVSGESNAVVGLATGSTPLPAYKALVDIGPQLDWSSVKTFNLDEYVDLDVAHEQSYRSFMFAHLFGALAAPERMGPRALNVGNVHLPRGSLVGGDYDGSEDLVANECQRRAREYEALIERHGPVGLQLLGIGSNGHIGFCEPGTPFDSSTLHVRLAESTRRANARFFDGELSAVPKYAITMGIGTILRAKRIVLMATGDAKADIVHRALTGPMGTDCPATALQTHPNVLFVLDEEAASRLLEEDVDATN
jgi:glucosamine-6-phosphate deaminase